MTKIIYLLFTLSGFVGLIYEATWARYLKLLLGHAAYGQMLTLCIFMGGLGIGALLAGRFGKNIRSPLLAYAIIELLLAAGGAIYHPLYVSTTGMFYEMVPGLSPWLTDTARIILAVGITMPMAILLGMTFPLLAISMARYTHDQGRSSLPTLYFTNSVGAAAGILVTSYMFIPVLGTHGTLLVAATGNALIAISFFILARKVKSYVTPDRSSYAELDKVVQRLPNSINNKRFVEIFLLSLALLTGLSSFIYEIGWIRLLSLLFGSSTHSFDIIVSIFVFGLAMGGLFAKYILRKYINAFTVLAIAQLLMGIFALLSIYLYKPVFLLTKEIFVNLDRSVSNYYLFSVAKYFVGMLMMFPATFFAGMTLPIITYLATNYLRNERYNGSIYGWNTIGSIFGATLASLLLLPVLQLKYTIATGALIDLAIGLLMLAVLTSMSRKKLSVVMVFVLISIVPVFVMSFNDHILQSGIFRSNNWVNDSVKIESRDGKTATISLHTSPSYISIRTNGKTDASVGTPDEITQAALAFLPMSMLDKQYNATVIGMGGGMTAHYLLSDPLLQKLDVIEIEEEVINLAKGFLPYNKRVYEDARSTFILDDARMYMSSEITKSDLIVSEPSNPWVSGVSSLFSVEFYEHVNKNLNNGGVFVQWAHLYEFNSELLLSILNSLYKVFPYVSVYKSPQFTDILIVASQDVILPDESMRFKESREISSDFSKMGIRRPDFFGSMNYIVSTKTIAPILSESKINSDYTPYVDSEAEKSFFTKEKVELFELFENSLLFYQEVFEPDTFYEVIETRYNADARVYRPQSLLMQNLNQRLIFATKDSDWADMQDMLIFMIPPDFIRVHWRENEVVEKYRNLVQQEVPPVKHRAFFNFIDNIVHDRTGSNKDNIETIIAAFSVKELSPIFVRAIAINSYMIKDPDLFRKIIDKFVNNNPYLNKYDKIMIVALEGMMEGSAGN